MTTTYDKHRKYWVKKLGISSTLKEMASFLPSDKVLDVGCGGGRLAAYAASQGVAKVCGLDYSGELIEVAVERYPGIVFYCRDVNNPKSLQLDDTYNVLVSNVAIRKDGVRLPDLLQNTDAERCYFRIQGERDLPGWTTELPLYSENEIRSAFKGWSLDIKQEVYQQKFTDEAYFRTFLERIGLIPREEPFQAKTWPLRVQRHYYCVAATRN